MHVTILYIISKGKLTLPIENEEACNLEVVG
jgi:hypothetical protein